MSYWVLNGEEFISEIKEENGTLIFENGLIRRELSLKDNSTVSLFNIAKNIEMLKSAHYDTALSINGKKQPLSQEFTFDKYVLCECKERVPFVKSDTMTGDFPYPPKGRGVDIFYKNELKKIIIKVHYEIYDGIPVIMKTVTVKNLSEKEIVVDNIYTDVLNITENRDTLFVDSDYNSTTSFLGLDFSKYAKNYARYQYDILEVSPAYRMNVTLENGDELNSITEFLLCFSAEYYEQKMIEVKSMYRRIAPWCLDNATFFHLISNSSAAIKKAVDQCQELGIEMIIQSFGSGVNMESHRESYLKRIKKAYDYGHSKNIRMGAYTLAYVKNYRPVKGDEALNHDSSHICRCLATEWSKKYMDSVINFIDKTGADSVEIDGPYGMITCSGGKTHLHDDFTDSQFKQWKMSVDEWYQRLKSRGVYINAPDWHYLNGTNRCGVGYEEIAFSEKRMEQLVTSRIYYYKGTFDKNPSQGWGFLPLNVYHGGGDEAKFFPTQQNSFEFDWDLAQIVASGVWPTIRGKLVYDSETGKEIFKKWVTIYKKYRRILNGITVHFMPPRIDTENPQRTTSLDAIMNLLPNGNERGFLMLFNQTNNEITQEVTIPVYYTGLTDLKCPPPPFENAKNSDVTFPIYGEELAPLVIKTRDGSSRKYITDTAVFDKPIPKLNSFEMTDKTIVISEEDNNSVVYNIDVNGNVKMNVTLPSMSYKWYILKIK